MSGILPGSLLTPNSNDNDETCDCGKPFTKKVAGEVDSFGYEAIYFCDKCYVEYNEQVANADTSGVCEWCESDVPKLIFMRDWEEGANGPIYEVCEGCKKRNNESFNKAFDDIDEPDDDDGYYEEDDDYDWDEEDEV